MAPGGLEDFDKARALDEIITILEAEGYNVIPYELDPKPTLWQRFKRKLRELDQ